MISKSILLLCIAAISGALSAAPVIEFEAGKKSLPANARFITPDGKFRSAANINTPIELDGKKAVVLFPKVKGAQSVYARMVWKKTPQGALFSCHRPMDGLRGYEAGFSDKRFFDLNGDKFSMQISAGKRNSVTGICDRKPSPLAPGKEYDCFIIYTPQSGIAFYAIDTQSKTTVFKRELAFTKALNPKAGEGILCIGGRRSSSKQAGNFAPEGTIIKRLAVWGKSLTEADISKYLGYTVKFPAKKSVAAKIKRAATTFYVNGSSGNDSNDGMSRKNSFKTIQRAADEVQAGDTVLIAPGVYFETVCLNTAGTPDRYITFKGEGKVIITAADRKLREGKAEWRCEDEKLNIYSVPFSHDPVRVLADGFELFPYSAKSCLKTALRTDGYPAPPHGFSFEESEQRLYVRFKAGQKPEKTLVAASPERASGANGHHVWKSDHANFHIGKGAKNGYIKLQNLTFETPGGAGVVTYASNVAVTDCIFSGCRFGVSGVSKARNIFIENCDYSQKGVHGDVMDVIKRAQKEKLNEKFKFYFWCHKSNRNSKKEMSNFETGIVGNVGKNWHIRNCRIDDSFEGFSSWCASAAEDFQVYGNTFRKIVDNAVETENKAKNVRVYNNYFEDVFEPISWQPLAGPPWPGPVFVYRNLVKTTENYKLHATALDNFMPGVFKLGVSGRNWQHDKHGNVPVSVIAARTSKRFVGAPGVGFLVFNNTFDHQDGGLLTTPNPLTGRANRELINFRFFNNIIMTKKMHIKDKWRAPLMEFYSNIVLDSPCNAGHRGIMSQENGKLLKNRSELQLNADWSLGKKSPALGNGILHFEEPDSSTDCGAVPSGTEFDRTCGAGTSPDVSKFSEFRRLVHYNAELIRSLGPEKGTWAVYSFDRKHTVSITIPENNKALKAVFRLSDCTRPHEDIARVWNIFKAEELQLQLTTKSGKTTLSAITPGGTEKYDLGELGRDKYNTLEIISGKGVYLNGKQVSSKAPALPTKGKAAIELHRNILYDLVLSIAIP